MTRDPTAREPSVPRIDDPDELDRLLARDGGELLAVAPELASDLGLLPEDVGNEEDIRLASRDEGDLLGGDV